MKPRENAKLCTHVREIRKMQHTAWRRREILYSSTKSEGCGYDSSVGTFFCILVREIRRLRLSMQFCIPMLKKYVFEVCTRVREIRRFCQFRLSELKLRVVCVLIWGR